MLGARGWFGDAGSLKKLRGAADGRPNRPGPSECRPLRGAERKHVVLPRTNLPAYDKLRRGCEGYPSVSFPFLLEVVGKTNVKDIPFASFRNLHFYCSCGINTLYTARIASGLVTTTTRGKRA